MAEIAPKVDITVEIAHGDSFPADRVPTPPPQMPPRLTLSHGEETLATAPPKGAVDKVGRNDPCPCGSGKKYKKCHGA